MALCSGREKLGSHAKRIGRGPQRGTCPLPYEQSPVQAPLLQKFKAKEGPGVGILCGSHPPACSRPLASAASPPLPAAIPEHPFCLSRASEFLCPAGTCVCTCFPATHGHRLVLPASPVALLLPEVAQHQGVMLHM